MLHVWATWDQKLSIQGHYTNYPLIAKMLISTIHQIQTTNPCVLMQIMDQQFQKNAVQTSYNNYRGLKTIILNLHSTVEASFSLHQLYQVLKIHLIY